jgi:uncharacterized Ntn-hydrolase superfamily protein
VTFSLVACDLEQGEWGVVVASKFLAVGAVVPWAKAEVGAVATQALANVNYGPSGLALLQSGRSAGEVVETLTSGDPMAHERQVGVVDALGRSASHTGTSCLDWAGHRTGAGYAAQGNLLAGPGVVDALAESFERTVGPLAERLLAALAAGDAAGGDRRGRQSACVIVRRMGGGYGGDNDLAIDLRIDDHTDPVSELQRLYSLHDLLFGTTPEDQLIPIEQVESEVGQRLGILGYHGTAAEALRAWADVENLEERLYDGRIDPVVLRLLRHESDAATA